MARLLLAVVVAALMPQAASQGFLDQLGGVASDLQKQAQDAGESISREVSPALASAKNATLTAVGDLKRGGEKTAVKALLWASGKCPDLEDEIDEAPELLAGHLAEAFASSKTSPAASKDACIQVAREGLEKAAETALAGESDQEKLAVKVVLDEEMEKVCTDGLMEGLGSMEKIRSKHREQYLMAIGDRLLLKVLTKDRLRSELSDYCGGSAETTKLFSIGGDEGRGGRGAPDPMLLPAAGCLLLLAAAVLFVARTGCSVTSCLLGDRTASEVERRFIIEPGRERFTLAE